MGFGLRSASELSLRSGSAAVRLTLVVTSARLSPTVLVSRRARNVTVLTAQRGPWDYMRYLTRSVRYRPVLPSVLFLFVCLLSATIFTHQCGKDRSTHRPVRLSLCLSQFLCSEAVGSPGPAGSPFWAQDGRAPEDPPSSRAPFAGSIKATSSVASHRGEATGTSAAGLGVALEGRLTLGGLGVPEKWTSWARPLRCRDGHLSTRERWNSLQATGLAPSLLHRSGPAQSDLSRWDNSLLH